MAEMQVGVAGLLKESSVRYFIQHCTIHQEPLYAELVKQADTMSGG